MQLFAEDFFGKVIKDINISKDFKTYKEANLSDYSSNEYLSTVSLKFRFNKEPLEKEVYYLVVISDVDSLIFTNAKYTRKNNIMTIKVDKNNSSELYFNYKYKEAKKLEFRCDVISEFEYKYLLNNEGILYGIAYGIIFCAFLYYLIIFFSTQILAFLYYSIMQLFVLFSLIGFVYISFLSYSNQEYYLTQAVIDTFETLAFAFTVLFAKEILGVKKNMPLMNILMNIFIIASFLDIGAIVVYKYSILYKYMAFEIGFLLPVIAGIIAIFKKINYAAIYTLGWSIMLIVVFLTEKFLITLSNIYTIHMLAPLESLIFSFALGLMLKKIIKDKNEKEKLLIHKSKLASMGEMIENIAHQWRQPLTHLGYINMNLEMKSQSDKYDKNYFIKKIKESNGQIKFMSSTIDDFRDFYYVEKEKQKFLVSNACQLAINIISPTLNKKKIKITLNIEKDSLIEGYENEYAQVILNFFTNSIDLFESRKIKDPTIDILIETMNNKSITKVSDNAEGIESENLDKIFDSHFSTKKRGSGIGLYMSRVIIQSHFSGNIYASNDKKGACFSIEV
jgi:signal transduction histidine kinase